MSIKFQFSNSCLLIQKCICVKYFNNILTWLLKNDQFTGSYWYGLDNYLVSLSLFIFLTLSRSLSLLLNYKEKIFYNFKTRSKPRF